VTERLTPASRSSAAAAVPSGGDGRISVRAVLVGTLIRAGLWAAAFALACLVLQEAGLRISTGYALADFPARLLMIAVYALVGAVCGLVQALAGAALTAVERLEAALRARFGPPVSALLARMFPGAPSLTVEQIAEAFDRLIESAPGPSRAGLSRMVLRWALRLGRAITLREARARAGADGRITLPVATAFLGERLADLVMGQMRQRILMARRLPYVIAALLILGPALWLAVRGR
jgi:hypothetical protein